MITMLRIIPIQVTRLCLRAQCRRRSASDDTQNACWLFKPVTKPAESAHA